MCNAKRIIRHIRLIPLALITALWCGCEVEDTVMLGTPVADQVTATTIDCHVAISGTAIPIDCGFYYGTSKDDVERYRAEKVKGLFLIDGFSATIEDLSPNTTHYIMGYAMNIRGRAYTETIEVTTPARAPEHTDNNYPGIVIKE